MENIFKNLLWGDFPGSPAVMRLALPAGQLSTCSMAFGGPPPKKSIVGCITIYIILFYLKKQNQQPRINIGREKKWKNEKNTNAKWKYYIRVSPLHNCHNHFYITLYFEQSTKTKKVEKENRQKNVHLKWI